MIHFLYMGTSIFVNYITLSFMPILDEVHIQPLLRNVNFVVVSGFDTRAVAFDLLRRSKIGRPTLSIARP